MTRTPSGRDWRWAESDVIGPDDIDKLREPAKRLAAWRRLISDTVESVTVAPAMTADGRPSRLWDPRRIDIRFLAQHHKDRRATASDRLTADTPGRLDPRGDVDDRRRGRLPQPRVAQLEVGFVAVRDSSVSEARRREPAVDCHSRRLWGAHGSVVTGGHGHVVEATIGTVAMHSPTAERARER